MTVETKYPAYTDSGYEWLREVPADWQLLLVSQVVSQVKKKNTDLKEQNLLSLSYGKIKRKPIDSNEGLLPASFDNYNIIEPGDIVLRLTDLQNDHTSLRVGLSREKGIITSAYVSLRPKTIESARFLYYVLHTFDIRKGFYGMGSGVRQGLNFDEVSRLRIPFPSIREQQAIADYLDAKTAQIDELVKEAKLSIEEYKNWKTSIIFEAVTKGLNSSQELVDSGIEWIGMIPKGWVIGRLGKFVEVYNGDRGTNYPTPDEILNEGIPFFTSYDLDSDEVVLSENTKYISKEKYESLGGYKTKIGDILFCLRGSVGKCAINTKYYDGTVASSLMGIRCKTINSRYAFYLLCSKIVGIQNDLLMNGTCAANLSAKNVCAYKVVIPPLCEQEEIVSYLDIKCEAINAVISEKQNLISDLEAYKKSLVYEVVTGKRKVV